MHGREPFLRSSSGLVRKPRISSSSTDQDVGSSVPSAKGADRSDHTDRCAESVGHRSEPFPQQDGNSQDHLVVLAASEEGVSQEEVKVCLEDVHELKGQLQRLRATMDGELLEAFLRLQRQLDSLATRVGLLSEWRSVSESQSKMVSAFDSRLAAAEGEVCAALKAREDSQRRAEALSAELDRLRAAGFSHASGLELRMEALETRAASFKSALGRSFANGRSQARPSESGEEVAARCESADAYESRHMPSAADLDVCSSGHRSRPRTRRCQKSPPQAYPQARAALELLSKSSQ